MKEFHSKAPCARGSDSPVDPRGAAHSRRSPSRAHAFTRAELLAVLVAVALLGAVTLPALAYGKPRAQRSSCANNLRQIGQGFRVWENDHADKFPWLITPVEANGILTGGTKTKALAWEHFAVISNELATARILACPSDTGRTATNFAINVRRNVNISYFIATHADEARPGSMLSGDRDVLGGYFGTCGPAGNIMVAGFSFTPITSIRWSATNHVNAGNVLFADGGVRLLSSPNLGRGISGPETLDGVALNAHILKPYLTGEITY
jgi:competence protein ComGC